MQPPPRRHPPPPLTPRRSLLIPAAHCATASGAAGRHDPCTVAHPCASTTLSTQHSPSKSLHRSMHCAFTQLGKGSHAAISLLHTSLRWKRCPNKGVWKGGLYFTFRRQGGPVLLVQEVSRWQRRREWGQLQGHWRHLSPLLQRLGLRGFAESPKHEHLRSPPTGPAGGSESQKLRTSTIEMIVHQEMREHSAPPWPPPPWAPPPRAQSPMPAP